MILNGENEKINKMVIKVHKKFKKYNQTIKIKKSRPISNLIKAYYYDQSVDKIKLFDTKYHDYYYFNYLDSKLTI